MQIKLNFRVLLLALCFFIVNDLEMYLKLMIFTLIHEMGHMFIGIALGLKPKRLEILPIGFGISFKIETKNYNKKILKSDLISLKKLIVSFAGPLVSIILAFLFYDNNIILSYINILIFVFNMLILYPLDGGRILKYILCIFLGRSKALFLTNIISNITAIILSIFTLYLSIILENITYIFAVIYIWVIIIKENKRYKLKRNIYKILKNKLAMEED